MKPRILARKGLRDPKRPRNAYGDRIDAARRRKGLTQEKLADALDVSVATVVRWCQGQAAPRTLDMLRRLAAVLDVPPGDLIS